MATNRALLLDFDCGEATREDAAGASEIRRMLIGRELFQRTA
jgi:hypothetical protein